MKAIIVTTKDSNEYKFVATLLKKLGVDASAVNRDQLEDIGLSKMLLKVDRSKKAGRSEIIKKFTVNKS